jgi:hypothetical protein
MLGKFALFLVLSFAFIFSVNAQSIDVDALVGEWEFFHLDKTLTLWISPSGHYVYFVLGFLGGIFAGGRFFAFRKIRL